MSLDVRIEKKLSRDFCLKVDFQSPGGILGILGASGCGKSITLKCIAGIETPDTGRIAVRDRTLFDAGEKINLKARSRRAGYLFQDYALFPKMTVGENIACGLRDKKRDGEKLREMTARFQLEGLEDRLPHQLSGGQRQRTALARMLINRPEVILLDEPFSALDTYLREQMQLQLLDVLREQQDVVMVSHSRDEVYKLCDRLVIMDHGEILARGMTKELFRLPGSVGAARLTGCKNISPIRRIGDRELEATDWGLRLRTAETLAGDIRAVGIRAHDLTPLRDRQPDMENAIRIKVLERSEDLFEWNFLFVNADSPESGKLWWKISKPLFHGIPEYLAAPPEAVLPLRGDVPRAL